MGCIEFWAVNSLLGSAMFFIVFLLVETQEDYFRYPIENKDGSAVALVLAAIVKILTQIRKTYGVLGVLLCFWKMRRERRMNEAINYQAMLQGPAPQEKVIKAR